MFRSFTKIAVISAFALLGSLGSVAVERLGGGIKAEPLSLPVEQSEDLPLAGALKSRVQFWVDIYSKYYSWQSLVHDREYPYIVYGVAESANHAKRPALARTQAIQRDAIEALKKLHKNREAIAKGNFKLSDEEKRLYDLFKEVPGEDKFLAATAEARFHRQAGLKDQLEKALFLAGRYLPRMKDVFRARGLPEDIAYLPFVESSFNLDAVSKVGASGIWQFMPDTAKEFLHVDDIVDERNDPMRSAEAAARLLKQNYEALSVWPLAITAYNHGRIGMGRAVRSIGSSALEQIIANYKGPGFGYASSNFYASFLAARHVAKNFTYYLGAIAQAKILEFDEFVVPDYVSIQTLAEHIEVSLTDLKELNPALSKEVWDGKYLVPVGYGLRVPLRVRDNFLARYDGIPADQKFKQQREASPTTVAQGPSFPTVPVAAGQR